MAYPPRITQLGDEEMLILEALAQIRELRAEVGASNSPYTQGYSDALSYMEESILEKLWEAGVDYE